MGDVKIYRVIGRMLLSHDRLPTWRKFAIETRALKPEHAVEKIYSELGSRHKLRRKHIVVEKIEEIVPEEVRDRNLYRLSQITGWGR